ncbi:AraC-like DNA-binding protein [Kibdelosporangium banguiense]|uniref:AraC-like DNA-binding protein n=1 Tax=Kibdelosporangium banguiense TaxID=1365924 RepID=A0ABS4U1X3_9PSEU|nr:AraC family transcriptional regulator [Kibdelosporangium banguiense]MBP2330219.1 AraC-like DNA-binding protein [Kibdelosporangium banguiense]
MYREYRPLWLADVVDCVWTSTRVGTQRVVPDGCMDIIFSGERLIVAGPDTAAFLSESTGPKVGVRFRPGAAPAFLDIPAHVLKNTRAGLEDLWARDKVERLIDDLHTDQPGKVLLHAVQDAEPDPFARVVEQLARRSGDVRAMAGELGFSERHLHRRCLTTFGYGPKMLHRVLRFDQAMDLIYAGTPFAEAAHLTGYADQAHLSREVKTLAGTTLSTLVQDADVTLYTS